MALTVVRLWLEPAPYSPWSQAFGFPGELSFTNAHNFVLDMVAWNGHSCGALAVWRMPILAVEPRLASQKHRGLACCGLPSSFFGAQHALVIFPFPYAYFLLPAGIWWVSSKPRASTTARSRSEPSGFGAFWCLGVLGSAVVREYFLVEEDFRFVRFENMRVGTTPNSYQIPEIHLLTQMGAMLTQARVEARPGMSPGELNDLGEVALRFPYAALAFRMLSPWV